MAFHRAEDDSELSDINITPLVDVMLVLLVAFIVTAPLMTHVVKVNLPEAAKTRASTEEKPAVLTITDGGEYLLNEQPVAEADLETRLRELKSTMKKDTALHLQADEALNYGKVVNVMALIERAGIRKLAVFTRPG